MASYLFVPCFSSLSFPFYFLLAIVLPSDIFSVSAYTGAHSWEKNKLSKVFRSLTFSLIDNIGSIEILEVSIRGQLRIQFLPTLIPFCLRGRPLGNLSVLFVDSFIQQKSLQS